MKIYPETQFAKMPNEIIEFKRNRSATELEEKLITLAVVDMQTKYHSLKASGQPIDWDYIATNKITAQQFSEVLKVTNNTQKLRQSLEDLKSLGLAVRYKEYVERTNKMHTFSEYLSIFKNFKFDETDNIIYYTFDDFFQRFFTEIGKHFQLSIAEIVGLHSAHTMRIYNLLKSKLNMDKTKFEFTILELKKYLNIEKKYKDYFDFKRFVLEIAKAQINASSSAKFQLEYQEIKEGKKVVIIEFEIISLGEKYYDIVKKLPNYKKDIEYKKFKKMMLHESNNIAEIARTLVAHIEQYSYNPEDTVFKMCTKALEIELEKWSSETLNLAKK